MTNKHTPTPWVLEDRRKRGEGFSIKSPTAHYSSCLVAHYIGENDANFIVRACNAHDDLVAALKDIATSDVYLSDDGKAHVMPNRIQEIAKQALAKAGAE